MARITPGESPLVVFVSSVISEEMTEARREAYETLAAYPYIQPWLFEYVPGSSEEVREGYLRKIRDSDMVIWLCGRTTTDPVRDELHEAIHSNRPLIVIRLSAEERDEATQSLLREISTQTRWCNVEQAGGIRSAIELTINDEIVRSFRGRPHIARLAKLTLLEDSSKARCTASWIATGLTRDQASALANDPSVGRPREEFEAVGGAVRLIIGDLGSGKSLLLERIHQKAIEVSRDSTTAPFPIYLNASSIQGTLRDTVLTECREFSDPQTHGVNLVIDRADEIGIGGCSRILSESRVLTGSWPATSVVLASRIRPPDASDEETKVVPSLTEDEGKLLVQLAWGREVEAADEYRWAGSIRDSIRRPLFALLLGSHLRRSEGIPESKGELIASLIQLALGSTEHSSELKELLFQIAIASIDRGGGFVPATDVISRVPPIELMQTGLILINRDSTIGFALPIFTEWFAALSLSTRQSLIREITQDRLRLTKWVDTLVVAISTLNREETSRILSTIVEHEPAIASLILSEGARQWGLENISAPPAIECGNQVRKAMESWINGIGPLAKLIAPVLPEGRLLPIVAEVRDEILRTGWAESDGGPRVLTPSSTAEWDRIRMWRGRSFAARPGSIPAWSWEWAKEELRRNLEEILRPEGLPTEAAPLIQENNWMAAQMLAKRGDLDNNPIPIASIQEEIGRLSGYDRLGYRDKLIWLEPLRQELSRMQRAGERFLNPPWPGPDREPSQNYIWSPYSDRQVLARARKVYGAAIEIYTLIVERWFPKFKWQLFTAAVLPARLIGAVSVNATPGISWYFEPRPLGNSSTVELELRDDFSAPDIDILYGNFQALRPASSGLGFHYVSSALLYIWGPAPATKLAYEWLRDDLRQIGWS